MKIILMYTVESNLNQLEGKPGKNTLAKGLFFQPKLSINDPHDIYEQEADAIADKVIRITNNENSFFKPTANSLQRKCAHCDEEERLQKKETGDPGNQTTTAPSYVHEVINSTGLQLDAKTRNFMEPRFGYDFGNVQIHNDSLAHRSAAEINALAYTHGNHVVFGSGQFHPDSDPGKRLLAHELAHVVQQQNASFIQRKGPGKEDEKVKLARETFEDDFDVFKKTYSITYVFSGFDADQKTPIKAVKSGSSFNITIGQSYVDEADTTIRQAWIRNEIIDKFITVDRFEDLAKDPTHSKLHEINPPYKAGSYCALNCPASAASLAEYLKSGTVDPAYCDPTAERGKGYGFDISMDTFSKVFTWKQAVAAIRKQLKKHGDFVVVEATRSEAQTKKYHLAKNHYFTVVNVKGTLFAIDAFGGGIVNDDLQDYIDNSIIATSYRLVTGEFKVKLVISK